MTRTLLRGARLEKVELTEAMRHAAVEAVRLVGLEVAAVDLLDVKGALKVFEVNSSPALTEMEEATGVDLAGAIIDRAETIVSKRQSASPESRRKSKPKRTAVPPVTKYAGRLKQG